MISSAGCKQRHSCLQTVLATNVDDGTVRVSSLQVLGLHAGTVMDAYNTFTSRFNVIRRHRLSLATGIKGRHSIQYFVV
jgi:hypothetical protein